MKSLALILILCAMLPLTQAACFVTRLKPGMTHCQDDVDKTWHAVGSSWRNSKCWDCTCEGCCDQMPRVTPSAGCKVEYDYQTCTFRVFNPMDPSAECPHSAVGK
ncbi:prostate-associated microseminoprotein [Chanos chanos]|uniref:Prostate-associated microseminoprotein n=1 Tax=Chanos chanos TaxID=29144 RepID=A0A6J2VN20_CHACN|nr:prostate-associated microseminoprotein-like [Chanos chanos]